MFKLAESSIISGLRDMIIELKRPVVRVSCLVEILARKSITSEEVLKVAKRIAKKNQELLVALKDDKLTLSQEQSK